MAENQALAVIQKEIESRGIPPATWQTMAQTLYPGSSPSSVLAVWDYCIARKLDPLKKPVHIVPMRQNIGGQWVDRETVLPGIYEYRTTAHRTGEYLGHDKPVYGPDVEVFGVTAPEWCEYTVYRWNQKANAKVPFSVRIMFREVCGTKRRSKDDSTQVANGRWERAPVQMLTKCAEAAALREAFPEEFGGTPTVEEIEDHLPDVIDVTPTMERIPTSWDKVPEEIRDNIEKAFGMLKLTAAQRLAKVNEFIKSGSEDEGENLLNWAREEYAKAQGKTFKRAEKVDNGKKAATSERAEVDSSARRSAEAEPSKPKGEGSDSRPAGAEVLAGSSLPADSTKQVPVNQIPFAGPVKPHAEPPRRKDAEYF